MKWLQVCTFIIFDLKIIDKSKTTSKKFQQNI